MKTQTPVFKKGDAVEVRRKRQPWMLGVVADTHAFDRQSVPGNNADGKCWTYWVVVHPGAQSAPGLYGGWYESPQIRQPVYMIDETPELGLE